jgi:spore germination protein GerM
MRKLGVGSLFALLLGAIGVLIYLNFIADEPELVASSPTDSPPLAEPMQRPQAAPGRPQPTPPGGSRPPGRPLVASARVSEVTLLFGSQDSDGLVPESRRVSAAASPLGRARTALEELFQGSRRGYLATVPEGTRLHEVYQDPGRVVYVDVSRDIQSRHEGGTSEELRTVYSIVGTVLANVPEATGVRILIDGRQQATLAGHVNITGPLVFSTDAIALADP